MSATDEQLETAAGEASPTELDERLGSANFVKRSSRKIFPDHWSFMLGEIALYSFIILLLTGTFLTLFFKPTMNEVVYDGSYVPLHGRADVRGVRLDAATSPSTSAAACSCGRSTTGRR